MVVVVVVIVVLIEEVFAINFLSFLIFFSRNFFPSRFPGGFCSKYVNARNSSRFSGAAKIHKMRQSASVS